MKDKGQPQWAVLTLILHITGSLFFTAECARLCGSHASANSPGGLDLAEGELRVYVTFPAPLAATGNLFIVSL